jgi:2-dehydropantoate 2-reductase
MSALTIIKPDQSIIQLTLDDFRAFPLYQHIADVNHLDKRFHGTGISLANLISKWGLDHFIGKVKLTASKDNYDITLELSLIKETAILIFALHDEPVPNERGGPFRLMIPGTRICKTDDIINNCANVKYIDCMQFL